MALTGRVSPFGHPRIKACSQLPVAFRSVPRPSSPLDAKASTKRPSLLEIRTPKQPAGRTVPSAGGKGGASAKTAMRRRPGGQRRIAFAIRKHIMREPAHDVPKPMPIDHV